MRSPVGLLLVLLLDLLLLHHGLLDPIPHQVAIGQSPRQHLPVGGGRLRRRRWIDHNLKLVPRYSAEIQRINYTMSIKIFKSPTFHPGPCLQSWTFPLPPGDPQGSGGAECCNCCYRNRHYGVNVQILWSSLSLSKMYKDKIFLKWVFNFALLVDGNELSNWPQVLSRSSFLWTHSDKL